MQFNIKRFILLLRKQILENKRLYLMGLAALGGFWLIVLATFMSQGAGMTFQQGIFGTGLLLGGAVFANQQFSALSDIPRSIRYLHLPASQLEKILAAFTLTCFVFLPAAIGVFYLVEIPLFELLRARMAMNPHILENLRLLPAKLWVSSIEFYWLGVSFMALGAVYFKKASFIKATLVFFGVLIFTQLFNEKLTDWLVQMPPDYLVNSDFFVSLSFYKKSGSNGSDTITLSAGWLHFFKYFQSYFTPFICWVLAWFRLRETTVA